MRAIAGCGPADHQTLQLALNSLPLLVFAAIESGKERVLRSTLSAVPVVATGLASMFGHGVVLPVVLATMLLLSLGLTVSYPSPVAKLMSQDDVIRPSASPPLAYVRVVEFTALGFLCAGVAIATVATSSPQYAGDNRLSLTCAEQRSSNPLT